jgi:hypothetical protein
MTQNTEYISKVELSVRRKEIKGLPGDDSTLHNLKIGSSLVGRSPLRGLDPEEEIKYLPEIIGISPSDQEWRKAAQEYWNNISVKVPADGLSTSKLQGLPLVFTLLFKDKTTKDAFDAAVLFEDKARISKQATVLDGLDDYILWRYCLVYSKVANRYEDVRKSPKILFYLYSKETETLVAHTLFKAKRKAQDLFATILTENATVDAVLLMFDQDLGAFESIVDKHLALDVLVNRRPLDFIKFMEDGNLKIKAFIKKAVEKHIIKKPALTDSYYYGDNNEVCLGTTLEDAVIFCKSTEQKNVEIINVIKAKLKQI